MSDPSFNFIQHGWLPSFYLLTRKDKYVVIYVGGQLGSNKTNMSSFIRHSPHDQSCVKQLLYALKNMIFLILFLHVYFIVYFINFCVLIVIKSFCCKLIEVSSILYCVVANFKYNKFLEKTIKIKQSKRDLVDPDGDPYIIFNKNIKEIPVGSRGGIPMVAGISIKC